MEIKTNQKNHLGVRKGFEYFIDSVLSVYENNLLAIKDIVDITDIKTLYCNSTNKKILENDYIFYVPNIIYNLSEKKYYENDIFCYNINTKQNPEYEEIKISNYKAKFDLPLGKLYIKKYLKDVTELNVQ